MDTRSRTGTSMLWRRLDAPGHDAARLVEAAGGAELSGVAVFGDEGGPNAIHYLVRCDAGWKTTEAHIQGCSHPAVQRYARQTVTTYGYEAELPGNDRFVGALRVDPHGWVLDYSGLWQAEDGNDACRLASDSG